MLRVGNCVDGEFALGKKRSSGRHEEASSTCSVGVVELVGAWEVESILLHEPREQ